MLTKLPGKTCDGERLFPDAIFSCLFLSLCTVVSASKIVVCVFMASTVYAGFFLFFFLQINYIFSAKNDKPRPGEHSLDS